jgi:hypothetical protein
MIVSACGEVEEIAGFDSAVEDETSVSTETEEEEDN